MKFAPGAQVDMSRVPKEYGGTASNNSPAPSLEQLRNNHAHDFMNKKKDRVKQKMKKDKKNKRQEQFASRAGREGGYDSNGMPTRERMNFPVFDPSNSTFFSSGNPSE